VIETRLLEPDLNAVASLVAQRMPDASVIVFTDDLRISQVARAARART